MTLENAHPAPKDNPASRETTPGGGREVRWEEVAKTSGLTTAEIVVGRLRAEGIPAVAWQEGAGIALGLTVGLLGMGHVMVPEEYADRAREILAIAESLDLSGEESDEDSDDFDEDEEEV